jgi:hypothetical protein
VHTSQRGFLRGSCVGAPASVQGYGHRAAAVLVLLCASSAWAQAPKPVSAEAAAAMERAQRSAANPMRAILQASKLTVAPRAEAPAATPRAVAVVSALQAVSMVSPTMAAPAPAPALAPSTVTTAKPAEVLYTTQSDVSHTGTTEVLAIEAPNVVAAVADQLSVAVPSAALAGSVIAPKLKHRVDPVLPQTVLDQVGQVREVRVNLSINADGSVADVAVQQPVPRQIVRFVQAAVAQWQFEPLPAPRAHTVQLVFSAE